MNEGTGMKAEIGKNRIDVVVDRTKSIYVVFIQDQEDDSTVLIEGEDEIRKLRDLCNKALGEKTEPEF